MADEPLTVHLLLVERLREVESAHVLAARRSPIGPATAEATAETDGASCRRREQDCQDALLGIAA